MSAPPSHTSAPSSVLQRTTAVEASSPAPPSPQFDRQLSSPPPQMQFGNSPPPTVIPSPTCHPSAGPSSSSQPRSRVRPRTPPVSLRSPTLNPALSNSSRRRLRLRRSPTLVPSRSNRSHRSSSPPHVPTWSRLRPSMPPDIVMRPPSSSPPLNMTTTGEHVSNPSLLFHNRHMSLGLDTLNPIFDSQTLSSHAPTTYSSMPPTVSAPPISGRIPYSSHAHSVDDRPHRQSISHASIYSTPAPSVLPTPASLANINTPTPQHPRTNGEMTNTHMFPFSAPPHTRTTDITDDPIIVSQSSPPSGALRLPPPHTRTNALEELIAVLEGRGPAPQSSHIISRTNLPSTSQPRNPHSAQPIFMPHPSSIALPATSAPSIHTYNIHQAPGPQNRLPPSISLPAPVSVSQPPSSRRDLAALFGGESTTPDTQNNRSIFRAAHLNGLQTGEVLTQPTISTPHSAAAMGSGNSIPHLQSVPTLLGRSIPRGHAHFLQVGTPPFAEPPLPPLPSQTHRSAHPPRVVARPLPLHHNFPDPTREAALRRQFHLSRLPSLASNDFNTSPIRPHGMEPELVAPSGRNPRRETDPLLVGLPTGSDEDDAAAASRTTPSHVGPFNVGGPYGARPNITISSEPPSTHSIAFNMTVAIDNSPSNDVQRNETRAGFSNTTGPTGENDAERAQSIGISRLFPSVGSASGRLGVPASNHPSYADDFEIAAGNINVPRTWVPSPRDGMLAGRFAPTAAVRRFMLDDGNEGLMPEIAVEEYMNTINNFRLRSRGRGRGGYAIRGMPPRSRPGLRMNIPRSPTESMLRRSEIRAMVAGREFGVPCGLFEYSVRGRPSLTPRIEWPEVVLISDENVKPRAPVLDLMSENHVQWCVRVGPLGNGEGDGRRGYMAFIHGLIEGGFAIELSTQGGCIYFWALSFPPYGECLLGVYRPTAAAQAASNS